MDSASILSFVGIACFLLAVVLGAAFGGRPERLGAGICFAGGGLTLLIQSLTHEPPYYAALLIDLAMAAAFGLLALKTPDKLWPGLAAVAQTLLMAFSATRALNFPLSEAGYVAALNLSSLGVALALLSGTWAHRFKPKAELAPA